MHPAAWHPDPVGRHQYRYWDGERWTGHVADDGVTALDPLESDGRPGADTGEGTSAARDTDEASESPTTPARHDDTVEQSPIDPAAGGGTAGPPPSGGTAGPPPSGGTAGPPPSSGTPPSAGTAPPTPSYAAGGPQPAAASSNGMAVAALVVGILSLLIAFIPLIGLIGVIGGLIALILGIVGRSKVRQGADGGGMAVAGIVTGALAIVIAVLITVGLVAFGRGVVGQSFEDYADCMDETGDADFCDEQLEEQLFDRMVN